MTEASPLLRAAPHAPLRTTPRASVRAFDGVHRTLDARGALRRLAAVALLAAAAGCSSNDPSRSGLLEPYRFGLPQGNYVTREALEQVKPGMTREQVRFALGSPLLNSIFEPDRWDYVYRYQHPSGRADLRRVTIRFKDDRVAKVDADELPAREDAADPALPGYRPPAAQPGGAQAKEEGR